MEDRPAQPDGTHRTSHKLRRALIPLAAVAAILVVWELAVDRFAPLEIPCVKEDVKRALAIEHPQISIVLRVCVADDQDFHQTVPSAGTGS